MSGGLGILWIVRALSRRPSPRDPMLLALGTVCLLCAGSLTLSALPAKEARAASTPIVFVQGGIEGTVGSAVDIPIAFENGGNHVAAASFTVQYDAACLAVAPGDQNQDGNPDAVRVDAPGQFRPSIRLTNDGQVGSVKIILADYMPPMAALEDTAALITIHASIVCPVDPGQEVLAYVRFDPTRDVGFSGPTGQDMPGNSRDGTVRVIGGLVTPTQTPTPGSGTPMPTVTPSPTSTPAPRQVLSLAIKAEPEQLSSANRNAIFVLDYSLLAFDSRVALNVMVPQYTTFDEAHSSIGWQCGGTTAGSQCRIQVNDPARPGSTGGRLFFATPMNWPPPASATQITLTITVEVNGAALGQPQELVVPLLTGALTPPADTLGFDLHTEQTELLAGQDQQVTYTFQYANNSQAILEDVEFDLLVPGVATVYPAADVSPGWTCRIKSEEQVSCRLMVSQLQPGAQGQAPFTLRWEPGALSSLNVLTLIVYAMHNEQVVSSNVSVIPVRQPLNSGAQMFLPLVIRG